MSLYIGVDLGTSAVKLLLMDDSGRLITEKADFRLLVNDKENRMQFYYVDGEVYAPVEEILALVQ